jgi:hypothetical protein
LSVAVAWDIDEEIDMRVLERGRLVAIEVGIDSSDV